jgi:hypothetical protein
MPDYLYDVALSFAGHERDYVREVAHSLKRSGYKIFFDEDEEVSLWGENLIEKLDEIYRKQSRYVVMFVSKAYADSAWTRVERRSALARALSEREAYVLPAQLDDTELPGLLLTTVYADIRGISSEVLAERIGAKVDGSGLVPEKGHEAAGWEWLLFADELEAGLHAHSEMRRDNRLGFAQPTGERVDDLTEIPSLVGDLMNPVIGRQSCTSLAHLREFTKVLSDGGNEFEV